MTLAALSNSTLVNQKFALPYHAIQSADYSGASSSNLKGKRAYLHCALQLKQRVQFAKLLTLHRRNLKSESLTFALPDGNDQAGSGSSHACTDDDKLLPLEDYESSMFSEAEIVSSISNSKRDLAESDEHMGNLASLLEKVKAVQLHVLASEQWNASQLKLCHRNYLVSATNLIHYLALRCLDIGQLTDDLSSSGLLNLETINSHVLASITACVQLLENLKSNSLKPNEASSAVIFNQRRLDQQKNGNFAIQTMRRNASSNRELLLGLLQDGRTNHIMVTVGQEVIENETLIADLIKAGTSIIRINCAHGSPSIWNEIIKRVKESSQMLEKPCRILMDLAGPKLRTGNLKPGPSVKKISPHKNAAGNVIFPAQVWMTHKEAGPPPAHLSLDGILFIDDQKFLSELEVGDTLRFNDARGKKRTFKISRKFHVFSGTGYVAECTRTAYAQSGMELYVKRKRGKLLVGKVVDVPAQEPFIRLRVGDLLSISRSSSSEQNDLSMPVKGIHRLTCPSGYLFDSVKPGEPIAFDDGKIWGVIQGTSVSEIIVLITHAGPKGTKLGSEKSINIPESNIQFEGLTSKDLRDLKFVATHADMVGISFVRDIRDIVIVRRELEKLKLQDLGIVLKIETKSGFEKLPFMLLEAMKSSNPLGVMIARGDLAVECGWEKLADLQEEILCVCGAAHIPVIWATQVLESLVKSGVPTRAEITDAASGMRASCIMLNKGKNVVKAVSALEKILHLNSTQLKSYYSLATSFDQK